MKQVLLAFLVGASALTATAQATQPVFTSTCEEGKWGSSGQKRSCETRDLTLPAPAAGQLLTIDGQRNGGISVKGYAGAEVRVRAKVHAWAGTEAEARERVQQVKISTEGNTLRATGPAAADGYAVSYEVFVPRQMALALTTQNGGINLEHLQGPVSFEAQNGGVSITGAGGDIRGRTQNGGLSITLTGSRWEGKGLNVTTINGGISWQIPPAYSAQLFTSTQQGAIQTSLPGNSSGSREVAVNLGQGGAPVRAVTTNGGIVLRSTGN
ncbi:hypothetical protein HNQ93_001492 [Hymenobacter luteus]|uniref:Adhesin domain-containing protein n=2 Tax=Hymenobacter TaxID=89966 RepID=A0A7W9SZJ8_9BACT|nr:MULTISPECIES: hypothetical protein [Hymenobacter]MBB4601147.1 hypothetical protein [Hymenobacter latericoloratus]MBB6058646.1 hypothetical protein [Hymenobacter luteus]